jgi:LacI family transcriptional regulator
MKKTMTIKDVAKLAGVSISTVSRVINDSKPVTEELRQRVLDVIEETNYVPNPLARSLVTKKSRLIGVVVPDVSDTFVNEILNGIEDVAKNNGYDVLLSNTYSDKSQEYKSLNLFKAKQVEGIVMISWILEESHVEFIQDSGLPAVYISKTARAFDIHTVSTRNEKATFDMTEFLISKGHRKIGFVMTSKNDTILEKERLWGYKAALEKNGIKIDEKLVKYGTTGFESGYNNMKELLLQDDIPEAVFVTGDEAAIGAINAAFDMGYRVPEDISVAGFNDVKIAKMYRPKLTTVSQPLYDMGAIAMETVIKLINGEDVKQKKIEIPYHIADRESVIEKIKK